jgi:hypothetical protein
MRPVAGDRRGIATVPVVVQPVVVPVPLVAVPVEVTHVQIAVSIAVMYSMPSAPPPFEYSNGLYFIWHLQCQACCTK